MSSPDALGLGNDCYLLNDLIASGTVVRYGGPKDIQGARRVGLQLETGSVRDLLVAATDAVVASTHTWTFKNGGFSASDVGATVTVSGAAQANNNAAVTISSVTDANTIVTNGTQTNETFVPGGALRVLVARVSTLTGTWAIEVSNNYSPGGAAVNGQAPNGGSWTNVTSAFLPTITQPAGAVTNQYVQADLGARAFRVRFIPASGAGDIQAIHSGGSY